jgi:hypothetical protein
MSGIALKLEIKQKVNYPKAHCLFEANRGKSMVYLAKISNPVREHQPRIPGRSMKRN